MSDERSTERITRLWRPTIWKSAAFLVGGALLGYAYYRLIGCSTGSCAITSNPYLSTLYGAGMGFLVSGILR